MLVLGIYAKIKRIFKFLQVLPVEQGLKVCQFSVYLCKMISRRLIGQNLAALPGVVLRYWTRRSIRWMRSFSEKTLHEPILIIDSRVLKGFSNNI